MRVQLAGALLAVAAGGACQERETPVDTAESPVAVDSGEDRSLATVPPSRNGDSLAATPDATRRRPRIMFIGTSLTAGYGLANPADAFPSVVGRMLAAAGKRADILNMGVSGETSAGARARIDWVLRNPADVIVLETGANDGLRGLSVDAARDNIQAIIDRIRAVKPKARILLVQMEAPPNLGEAYTKAFHAMYPALAGKNGVELVPFLLAGVAGEASLNQADGIHPNREGARTAARTVYDVLVKKPLVVTD